MWATVMSTPPEDTTTADTPEPQQPAPTPAKIYNTALAPDLIPAVDLSPGNVLRLKPDDIALIDAALRKTGGNRRDAAILLGVAYIQLSFAISRHPSLRSTWSTKDESYANEVSSDSPRLLAREKPGEVTTTEQQRASQLTRVEGRVGKQPLPVMLKKLGFKAHDIESLSSVEEFAGQHFSRTLALMHGSVVKSSLRATLLAERIEREYLTHDDLPESERRFWWEVYFKLLEALRGMSTQANQAAITRATIEMKRKPGLGRPGFSPAPHTAIQINATSVEVREDAQ